MTVETRPTSDIQHRKEHGERLSDPYAGLHARMLIGEPHLLDHDKPVPDYAVQQIDSFKDRNYEPIERTSKRGRRRDWKKLVEEGKVENNKQAKYAFWEGKMLTAINEELSAKQREDIFNPIFRQMGINNEGEFTKDDVKKLHDHYFLRLAEAKGEGGATPNNPKDPNNPNTPVKRFIADVMETFKKQDGKPDEDKIRQHLPMLEQFAMIFGEKEASMVAQMLMAEVHHANNREIAKQTPISRINNPTEKEKEILTLIKDANPLPDLPVLGRTAELQNAVTQANILALAETGAGKTVGIPPLIRETLKPGETILVTQPQQNTAISTPNHIAGEFSLRVPEDIGYITGGGVKFDRRKTDVIFVTERIALYQMLDRDEWFKRVRHMMFDEAHKLSPDMEIMAGLALEEQQRRMQEGAKITLTNWFISATADEKKFKNYLGIDNPIKIEGRTFGKDVKFLDESLYDEDDSPREKADKLYQAAAEKAAKIHRDPTSEQGDIIISAAGNNEMTAMEEYLNAQGLENIQIVKIHSGSTKTEKDELKKEAPKGIRRIIVGTNAMETGVTVKGAKYVINTGEKKEDYYDPVTGMTYVPKVLQSQAEARQWEGRVGRTSFGHVIHLMTEEEFRQRPEQPISPIQRTDITQYILLLKAAGKDIRNLKLPSVNTEEEHAKLDEQVNFAEETLQKLGALDASGTITDVGKHMAEIPTDYHITRAIAEAEKEKKGVQQMYALGTILDVIGNNSLIHDESKLGQMLNPDSEFLTYLNIWQEFAKHGYKRDWAQRHGVKYGLLKQIDFRLKNLRKKSKNWYNDTHASDDELGYYIYLGYKDRLMKRDEEKGSYVWDREHVRDVDIIIDRDSLLSGKAPEYVISIRNSKIGEKDVYEEKSYKDYDRRGRPIHRSYREATGETTKHSRISMLHTVNPKWLTR